MHRAVIVPLRRLNLLDAAQFQSALGFDPAHFLAAMSAATMVAVDLSIEEIAVGQAKGAARGKRELSSLKLPNFHMITQYASTPQLYR